MRTRKKALYLGIAIKLYNLKRGGNSINTALEIMTTSNNNSHKAESTIVMFHIGRGGRFNNQGYKTFKGINDITDCSDFENNLFLNEETNEWLDCSGNEVGLTLEESESGIGRINIDNDYDTTYTTLLSGISAEELEVIMEYSGIDKDEVLEMLSDFHSCDIDELEIYI